MGDIVAGNTGHITEHNRLRKVPQGGVTLESFDGASDDAKLAAWVTAYGGTTYPAPLLLTQHRDYTFSQQFTAFEGMAIINPYGLSGQQNKTGSPIPNSVSLNTSGGWITLGGNKVTSCVVAGLSFDCGSAARVVEPGGQMFYWRWDSIGFQNGLSILGSAATKQGTDGVFFTGTWNINNVRECAFNLGGSDGRLCPDSMYLDSPGNTMMADSGYLFRTAALTKQSVSGWYVTADRHSAFLISSGASTGMLRVSDMTIEGRNATTPCFGALVRVTNGAGLRLVNSQLNFAMTSPTTLGHGDEGYVHVDNGFLDMAHCSSLLASGQSTSTPLVYVASGSSARIRALDAWDSNGAKYTPTVQQAATGLIDADDSVTVVTAA